MKAIVFFGASSDIAIRTVEMLDNTDIIHETKLILVSRDTSNLPQSCESYKCDPTDMSQVEATLNKICNKYTLASVVNFCGNIMLKPISILSEEDWHNTIKINLTTSFNISHVATKIADNFSLIFFSSAAASIGLANHEAIAAAKSAVEGLSKSIAASYLKKNIRSNVIAPGLVETKLSTMITKSEAGKSKSEQMHPVGRLGNTTDIASIVIWLLEPKNNWITAQVIKVDGGLSGIKI